MRLTTVCGVLGAALIGLACIVATGPAAAAPPAPPVSTFAPAADLVQQLDAYVNDLDETVASEAEYKDSEEKVVKEANTLILIALALGLHDTDNKDNKYKTAAPAIIKAAKDLAAANNYAAAKAGVAALKAAMQGQGAGGGLKWEKVASLEQLMKQVPVINTKLKMKLARLSAKNVKDTAGYSAVLAVIAQGSIADTSRAKSDAQVQQWQEFCVEMRDSAGAEQGHSRQKLRGGATGQRTWPRAATTATRSLRSRAGILPAGRAGILPAYDSQDACPTVALSDSDECRRKGVK